MAKVDIHYFNSGIVYVTIAGKEQYRTNASMCGLWRYEPPSWQQMKGTAEFKLTGNRQQDYRKLYNMFLR